MRADARLQGFDARPELCLLLLAPLALQVDVAQQQRRHDQADQPMAQVEVDLAIARQRSAEVEVVGQCGACNRQAHHQGAAEAAGECRTQARQQRPQLAQQGRRKQHNPLHEERRQGQSHPVEARQHRLGQHQHQHQQLGQKHQPEQCLGQAELRQEEIVVGGFGTRFLFQALLHPGHIPKGPAGDEPGSPGKSLY
ncbi:hypothetical protein D3C81_1694280 [compost metagenome]